MNLLPKTDLDFSKAEYWNKFFRERGAKEFEWYGEYAELHKELLKYMKKEDQILIIGCGNSMLGLNLFDVGFRQITNIDISSVVIKEMKKKVAKDESGIIFEQMDVLNMSYESEKFTLVLDKGTLDALLPSDNIHDRKRAEKLFSEVDRVLKVNGRYIIISLLQNHVLKELLNYFFEKGWLVRICRCWDVEWKKINETGSLTMPVFVIVCVKFKRMQNTHSVLEVNVLADAKFLRVKSKEEVMAMIEGVQRTIFYCKEAKGEIEIQFCRNNQDTPSYSIYIVDASQDQRHLLTYAAFIVPHGRECEWLFGSQQGRKYLRSSSGFDRLAVITFHRGQEYGTMEEIQDELRLAILQLAPPFMPISKDSPKVPYLTLGDGVGRRDIVYSDRSEVSGELLIEEVDIENETFRRLVFMSNQSVVQSEVKLKKVSPHQKQRSIDHTYIASNHILYLSIPAVIKATSLERNPESNTKTDSETYSLAHLTPVSIAVVGLGGGGLCLFLRNILPESTITGVEIDPLVVKLAKEFFGFKTDDRMKVVVSDGVKFLKEKKKFDVIILDVDSKERGSAVSCPPPQFLEHDVLKAVANVLGDSGIFVTNVVTRLNEEFLGVIRKVEKHFSLVARYSLKEDVNKIIFASNMKSLTKKSWKITIENAAVVLLQLAQEKTKTNSHFFDMCHLMNELTVSHE